MGNLSKKYITPFDGLRVIALLSVLFYHIMPNFVPSGYLGVVIFFVLAGFLTMLPLKYKVDKDIEAMEDKSITFKKSLFKILIKVFKLYPSLAITIILVTITMILFFKPFLSTYFMEALTSFLSINNFYQILNHESYFEAMNSIKPLTHIWALSLEFQFYILFYLIVNTFYNKSNKKKFFVAFLVLAIISFALSFVLIINGAELTRVYYGLDTRLSAFLTGMIACIVSEKLYFAIKKYLPLSRLIELILTIFLIILMFLRFNNDLNIITLLNVYSIIFAVLLILLYNEHFIYCAKNKDLLSRRKINNYKRIVYNALSLDAFSVIVKRSYIIYLVHYPVVVFVNRFTAHTNINTFLYIILLIALSILLSEAIYRFLIFLNVLMSSKKRLITVYSTMLIVFFSSLCFAKIITPKTEEINYDNVGILRAEEMLLESTKIIETAESIETIETAETAEIIETTETPETTESTTETRETIDAAKAVEDIEPPRSISKRILASALRRIQKVNETIGGEAILDESTFFTTYGFRLSVIGDSLTSSAKGSMSLYFPDSFVNSKGSRELDEALTVFNEMKQNNEIADGVVIALGTNSSKSIDLDALESLYVEIQKLDKKIPMIVLSIVLPYKWQEEERNDDLLSFINTHEYCFLADWHTCAKTHKECFMEDNIHPMGIGNDLYAQVIYKAYVNGMRYIKNRD